MKKFAIKFFALFALVTVFLSVSVSARQVEIKNAGVTSIEIADDYFIYTKDYQDEELSQIDFSNESDPYKEYIELMGLSSTNSNVILYVIKDETLSGNTDLPDTQRLAADYSLIKDKSKFADDYKTKLSSSGSKIETVEWIEFENGVTPYIMGIYSAANSFVTEFTTQYNTDQVVLRFIDTAAPDAVKIEKYKESAKSIAYSQKIDYKPIEEKLNAEEEAKITSQNAEQEKVEKNSDYILWAVAGIVVLVLIFSIYLATRKRKNSIVKND